MTAPLPPDADELVSAYLDGEAAPDEIAVVEANPELMARVEALRSVTEALAPPVTPPASGVRQAHLSAALAAFDDLVASGDIGATSDSATEPGRAREADARVTSLAAARERRRPRRLSMIAAAAAAVALVFAGIVAVGLDREGSQDVVSSLDESVVAGDDGEIEKDEPSAPDDTVASQAAPESAALAPQESGLADADDGAATFAEAEEESADAARAAPAPTLAPPAADAADADEEAADEEAAEDPLADEVAEEPVAGFATGGDGAEDDAAADAAGSVDAEQDLATEAASEPVDEARLDFGVHEGLDTLADELTARFTGVELADEVGVVAAVAPPSACPDTVVELLGTEEPTLLGLAVVEGRPVEVHLVDAETVTVLNRDDCTIAGDIILDLTGN